MKKLILLGSAVLVLAAGCNSKPVAPASTSSVSSNQTPAVAQNVMPNSTNATSPKAVASTFTDENLSINVLPGWTAKQSTVAALPEAVNITKGNYILYINPLFGHASGIEGGRFTEVVSGMPSLDLVMANVEQPSNASDCASVTYGDLIVTNTLKLTDLYTNSLKQGAGCVFPSGNQPVWFGAYANGTADTIFGRTSVAGSTTNDFVITVAYNTNNVNNLPKKNDPVLNQTLTDVVTMLKTLRLR
jgi:hypothetical protein